MNFHGERRLKVGFVSNSARGEYTGRMRWIKSLRNQGIDVTFLLPTGEEWYVEQMLASGIDVELYHMNRKSTNPYKELRTIGELISILGKRRFDIIHSFGHKANLYATMASVISPGSIVFNHITGMGAIFTEESPSTRISVQMKVIRSLYFLLNWRTRRFFFQNEDDKLEFKFVAANKCINTNGTGADLDWLDPRNIKADLAANLREELSLVPGDVVVTFVGRLLLHKGIRELIDAVLDIIASGLPVRLLLVGQIDSGNTFVVPQSIAEKYRDHSRIHFLGRREDVREILAISDIFVNPSYREGLPRTNIEALAMSLPVVTTEAPGCRLTVENGINGFKVPPKTVKELTEALTTLVLDQELRERMGVCSRKLAEEKFSAKMAAQQVGNIYWQIFQGP